MGGKQSLNDYFSSLSNGSQLFSQHKSSTVLIVFMMFIEHGF